MERTSMERTNHVSYVTVVGPKGTKISIETMEMIKDVIQNEFLMYLSDVTLVGLSESSVVSDLQTQYPRLWKNTKELKDSDDLWSQAYHFIVLDDTANADWVKKLKAENQVVVIHIDTAMGKWTKVTEFNQWTFLSNTLKSILF